MYERKSVAVHAALNLNQVRSGEVLHISNEGGTLAWLMFMLDSSGFSFISLSVTAIFRRGHLKGPQN